MTDYECLDEAVKELLGGKWVDSDRVEDALGLTFNECFGIFDFCREVEWWSVVGETDEERARNGQKVTCYFRVKSRDEGLHGRK